MNRTRFHRWAEMLTLSLLLAFVAVSNSGCATTAHAYASPRGEARVGADDGNAAPAKAETVYGMAKLLIAGGDVERGERMLFSLTLTHPKFTPAYSDLAEIRMRRGRIDEAVQFLSSGLEISAYDPVLLNNLGVCSLMKGEYEDALESFEMAGAVFPYDEQVGTNTAAALALLGHEDESLATYKRFVSEDDAQFNLEVLTRMRLEERPVDPDFFFEILEVVLEDPMKELQVLELEVIEPLADSDPASGS